MLDTAMPWELFLCGAVAGLLLLSAAARRWRRPARAAEGAPRPGGVPRPAAAMLARVMRQRFLSLTLALLLLITQQWGVLHGLSHGLHGAGQGVAAAQPASEPGPRDSSSAADALCQVCLVLATLGAATLPDDWPLPATDACGAAPVARAPCAAARPAGTPYLARAPPALSVLI